VREFGQHAIDLVLDQAVDLPVRAVAFVLESALLADVVRAEAVKNVDGVDDDDLERMFALGEFGADLQELSLDSPVAVLYSPACSS